MHMCLCLWAHDMAWQLGGCHAVVSLSRIVASWWKVMQRSAMPYFGLVHFILGFGHTWHGSQGVSRIVDCRWKVMPCSTIYLLCEIRVLLLRKICVPCRRLWSTNPRIPPFRAPPATS